MDGSLSGYKTVNLEEGMPTSDRAIKRLTAELYAARSLRYAALKLIHGYGSSGAGGVIRVQARKYLDRQIQTGLIKGYIPGERFEIFDKDTLLAMQKYRFLSKDSDLGRHNNGITIVLM